MLIAVIGVNHRTAPLDVREKLSFPEYGISAWLKKLQSSPGIEGCAILSTCNRTEIYIAPMELDTGMSSVWSFLSEKSGLDISEIKNYTFCHTLYDAIRHLFRVVSGLDSMILGETQILGQVKRTYELALEAGTTNVVLNTLFQQAITTGKRVRTETGIDQNPVSIPYAAVELAKQNLGSLEGRSVLVVGAGEMSEITAVNLVANGVSSVIVSNRSYDRAVQLAEKFNGTAVKFDQLFDYMAKSDIVISSTAARHYVIKPREVEKVMALRGWKDIMMIDIAVPRDIDPEVGKLPGVTLYDVDSLQNVVDANLAERRKAAVVAEGIIEEELDEFMKWLSTRFVVPTITALKKMAEEIKQRELHRAFNRLGELNEREKKIISSLASSIVNQLLHTPVIKLKQYALTPEGHLYTEILQNLFNLQVEGQRPQAEIPPPEKKQKRTVS
ncbi:Glutamyl-tRNA reductase [Desulfotomaculum nigrificans CO-1-SRB]|uniref:Glutamyl-tRNA reductase n=1 Tax=Desulfotomaculum nigrificans (strain DSM 14880 / VKM B-2319 / CO-1-SRB) TaxID=868595 RepID=F6B6M6_DESCC|nr:glutamyl-tRNA reductase [Desulfotomaculum nigrificans]AEF94400.1 Glutamyl-tRNA reductase [Desulfotomaculum nigrificans CO-1-SRB]